MANNVFMYAFAASVLLLAAFFAWLDVIGYVQCVSWLWDKFGAAKAIAFSLVLRWHFLPAWPEASDSLELADANTRDFFAFIGAPNPATGFLFIPGALVHPTSYAPILARLARESGALCVCVRPRFRHPAMWASDESRALSIVRQYSHVSAWTIGGHSMGAGGYGAARVASRLAASGVRASNASTAVGLVMWAGVITKGTGVDMSKQHDVRTLVILGSEDSVVPPDGKAEDGTSIRENLGRYSTPDTKLVVIKGGNHGGFGHYGPQLFPRPDKPRTIPLEDQHTQVVRHTADFLRVMQT